jgi:hypothetical protein
MMHCTLANIGCINNGHYYLSPGPNLQDFDMIIKIKAIKIGKKVNCYGFGMFIAAITKRLICKMLKKIEGGL